MGEGGPQADGPGASKPSSFFAGPLIGGVAVRPSLIASRGEPSTS